MTPKQLRSAPKKTKSGRAVTWEDLAKLLPKNDKRPFVDDAYYRKKGVIK